MKYTHPLICTALIAFSMVLHAEPAQVGVLPCLSDFTQQGVSVEMQNYLVNEGFINLPLDKVALSSCKEDKSVCDFYLDRPNQVRNVYTVSRNKSTFRIDLKVKRRPEYKEL
jgi:hypothetical protein